MYFRIPGPLARLGAIKTADDTDQCTGPGGPAAPTGSAGLDARWRGHW